MLHAGQQVHVALRLRRGAGDPVHETVLATIEEILPPERLPAVFGAPPAELVSIILREWQVDLVALITYDDANGETLMFAALHGAEGWRDLRGQPLAITPAKES